MNKVDLVEKPRLRDDLPDFRPGDTVKVHARVVEAGRERIQVFQGVVIRRQGGELVGVPYHIEYKPWLTGAAKALREAAALSPDKAFANWELVRIARLSVMPVAEELWKKIEAMGEKG